MPRNDDRSAGDARAPYADQGGTAGRHAQTHDVRREEATRSERTQPGEDFSMDLVAEHSAGGHVDESTLASDDKELRAAMPQLGADDLKQLSILTVGTSLDQGSTYVDLDDLGRGPFKAMGAQQAGDANRYVAKRDTDYELWDRIVGQGRQPEIERPPTSD